MNKQDLKDVLMELAHAIASLKESECGNSGLNWLDEFKAFPLFCEHVWTTQRQGGDPTNADSEERVTFCKNCGVEKMVDSEQGNY